MTENASAIVLLGYLAVCVIRDTRKLIRWGEGIVERRAWGAGERQSVESTVTDGGKKANAPVPQWSATEIGTASEADEIVSRVVADLSSGASVMDCPMCGGTGDGYPDACQACGGSGEMAA